VGWATYLVSHVVLWLKLGEEEYAAMRAAGKECSHLCSHSLCQRGDHLLMESHWINAHVLLHVLGLTLFA
jgi:Zinc-binding loop region of homing endonuclease